MAGPTHARHMNPSRHMRIRAYVILTYVHAHVHERADTCDTRSTYVYIHTYIHTNSRRDQNPHVAIICLVLRRSAIICPALRRSATNCTFYRTRYTTSKQAKNIFLLSLLHCVIVMVSSTTADACTYTTCVAHESAEKMSYTKYHKQQMSFN